MGTAVLKGPASNVEDDLTLPALPCLDELEAMGGDCFHVGTRCVMIRIKFFSQGNRFQPVSAMLMMNLDWVATDSVGNFWDATDFALGTTSSMPPFGNLYGTGVFVSRTLSEDKERRLNAGSHDQLIRLAYKDFERLVNPRIADFSVKMKV